MSSTITTRLDEPQDPEDGRAGVARSEPGGRAQRRAGAARRQEPDPLADRVRELLPNELIDQLMAGARTGEEITGQGGLLSQLTKRMVERAMEVELTDHLGYEPHQEPPGGVGNTRNGSTPKTLVTEHGPVRVNTPRDREGSFEPQIVRKRERRFEGFDDKILALYARGLSTRDISAHLEEIYGVEVGRDLISKVTDAVMEDARAWQTRPLDDVYPVVFLDALVLKIRDGGSVIRKACYLALGINLDGDREVLGLWFQDTEGAKFWMQVLVRHEALLNRVEVKDRHRPVVAAIGWKLRSSPPSTQCSNSSLADDAHRPRDALEVFPRNGYRTRCRSSIKAAVIRAIGPGLLAGREGAPRLF
jgi:putative transposase